MTTNTGSYHVVDFPPERRFLANLLNLTVVFDHDVIDGASAARFTRRLVELIESGYGLYEDQTMIPIDTEPAAVRTAQVLA